MRKSKLPKVYKLYLVCNSYFLPLPSSFRASQLLWEKAQQALIKLEALPKALASKWMKRRNKRLPS